ncbi:(2Fe-2S) ferredoxin domain-containing protein [Methylobacterium oxalidis]|uniref:(2Fe-2S) ferredoxin domain-containing protein n=1 Tax=Methylobacterium oxalidis TaxID=944322 RepID=UPI00331483E9
MSDPIPALRPKPRTAKTKLEAVIVVCAKCAKRQSLGSRAVRGLLKRGLKRGHPKRKVRVVETGCLGPCPKRALAVATGASLARGRVVLLDPAATPEEAVAALLPEFGPKAGLAPATETGEEPNPLS